MPLIERGADVAERGHVLVVDDDEMLARTLADVLSLNGFDTTTAKNGESALALAQTIHPSVAVVDLRLPDMDGLDLASRLHATERELQVVILTGNASIETAIRALRDENCDYLIKPVEPAALVRTMRAADNRRRLRSTEEALRRSQSLARAVFESSPLPVVVLDRAAAVTLWNPAAEQLFGWTREEALAGESRLLGEAVSDDALHRFEAALRGETFVGLEVKRHTKDGRTLDLRQTVAPILGAEGTVDAVLLMYEDITERRRMDAALRDAQRLDQIGRVAGSVAHDFNNLLGVIMAEAEAALLDPALGLDGRDSFTNIVSASRAGADLTRQLLSFARRHPVEPVVLDPNILVQSVERMFGRLLGGRISMRTNLAHDVGTFLADRAQVEQVLANLVVNARDAMPDGGVLTLTTRRHVEPAGGHPALERREWVVVSVHDTGMGIPPAVRSRIFEPFFTTKPRGQGTGLGLATCYGIVQQAGGVILVESSEGLGSEFRVHFPRVESRVAPITEEPTNPRGSAGTIVLVVEDQPELRAVARRVLESHGYVVWIAESAAAARERLTRSVARPDVLVVDVNLPDADGRDLVDEMLRHVPGAEALVTSGAANLVAQVAGAPPFLAKPYSIQSLLAAVGDAADRAERRRAPGAT